MPLIIDFHRVHSPPVSFLSTVSRDLFPRAPPLKLSTTERRNLVSSVSCQFIDRDQPTFRPRISISVPRKIIPVRRNTRRFRVYFFYTKRCRSMICKGLSKRCFLVFKRIRWSTLSGREWNIWLVY